MYIIYVYYICILYMYIMYRLLSNFDKIWLYADVFLAFDCDIFV